MPLTKSDRSGILDDFARSFGGFLPDDIEEGSVKSFVKNDLSVLYRKHEDEVLTFLLNYGRRSTPKEST